MTFDNRRIFPTFRRRTIFSARCLCVGVVVAFLPFEGTPPLAAAAAKPDEQRVYTNRLTPITNPQPLLADRK